MMAGERTYDEDSPLTVYCYRQISDAEVFCELLKTRFRNSGHTRGIEFRFWDCYKEPPGRDGDIYIYDGMALSWLAANGYIRRLPDIIDTSGVFEWVLNGSKVKKQIYGIPFTLCANVLISRKNEAAPLNGIPEGRIAAPMRSMLGEYYVFAYFNSPERGTGGLAYLKRLKALIGGNDAFQRSRFAEYDGIERFISGECRYLLGFSEDLRFLPPDEYAVTAANLSDGANIELPLYFVNYISVGARPSGERLLDCLDLAEIVSDGAFFTDYCTAGGQLRYLLPANKTLYAGLCARDEVYRQLLGIVSDENNCVLRYGKSFYEEFPKRSAELLAALSDSEDEKGPSRDGSFYMASYMEYHGPAFSIPPGTPVFRQYEDRDYETVHGFYAQAFHLMRQSAGWFPHSVPEPPSEEMRRDWARTANERFVYETEAGPIGYSHTVGDRIGSICIAPAFQGKGYGKTFLQEVTNAILRDHDKVSLYCVVGNTKARAMYLSLGFSEGKQKRFTIR